MEDILVKAGRTILWENLKKEIQNWQRETFPLATKGNQTTKLEEEIQEWNEAVVTDSLVLTEASKTKMRKELADIVIVCCFLEVLGSSIGKFLLDLIEVQTGFNAGLLQIIYDKHCYNRDEREFIFDEELGVYKGNAKKKLWIDLETGGLSSDSNPILQMAGLIEIDDVIKEKFNFFIHPFAGQEITPEAFKLFGRTQEEIANFPMPDVVFREIINLLGKYIDFWDPEDKFDMYGYNVKFDEGFIRQFFKNNATNKLSYEQGNGYGNFIRTPSIDVMVLAAEVLAEKRKGMLNFQLQSVYRALFPSTVDTVQWHDAMDDIIATRYIYLRLKEIKDWI